MNSAYSYKYANLPSDYYDYSYDAGTLTDIPSKNMYKKRNNMFTRIYFSQYFKYSIIQYVILLIAAVDSKTSE